jgi:hypothetical protein
LSLPDVVVSTSFEPQAIMYENLCVEVIVIFGDKFSKIS